MTQLNISCFQNVDLILYSRVDLQPLVEAMGERVIVLYLGREKRAHKAVFEVSGLEKTPESVIRKFCKLIGRLPPDGRKLWDTASARTFDIGIGAPGRGDYYWSSVDARTVRAVAEINARVAVTVYGPMKTVRVSAKARC